VLRVAPLPPGRAGGKERFPAASKSKSERFPAAFPNCRHSDQGISLTNRHGRTRDLIISHLQWIVAQHLLKRG
jgi:hypothetical protein